MVLSVDLFFENGYVMNHYHHLKRNNSIKKNGACHLITMEYGPQHSDFFWLIFVIIIILLQMNAVIDPPPGNLCTVLNSRNHLNHLTSKIKKIKK